MKLLPIGVAAMALCAITALAQSGLESIYQAVRANDLPALELAIRQSGATARDSRGTTPLMYAAAIGGLDAMKLLVKAGTPVDATNSFGATALMWCAGDLDKVRFLLDHGASVTVQSNVGRTPLSIAATYDGSVEIGRLMIARGADVKALDKGGASVLHSAASANNLELARLLLAKGADPNVIDGARFTPLSQAAGNGERSAALVKLLLDHGASANAVSIDSVEMMKNGPIGIGRLTPLLLAAGQSNYQTVELLVKAGANVNAQDIRGMTPLAIGIATDHSDPRIVRLLLAHGADRNLKANNGDTALDVARKFRDPAILRALGLPRPKSPAEPTVDRQAAGLGVRQAIEKSAALLQGASKQFLEKGGCPACHAQHHTGMAVAAAKAVGIAVNWSLELEESRATASLRGGLEQTLFQAVDPPPGTDGNAFALLQINAAGLAHKLSTDSLVFHLAAMQRKEGDWPAYGVVRPPLEDGGFAITAKAIRALRDNLLPGRRAEFEDRLKRAADWLVSTTTRTTEDRTMQLLGIAWSGRQPPKDRVRQLIALQRRNGGWGQTENLPTDAYATGEALYALHETGMEASDPVYRRGVDFLLRAQREDGSWLVKSRSAGFQPYFESGFPHGHDQWISQSGTAWAVIALSYAADTYRMALGPR